MSTLRFLGAARTVTGSRFLIETDGGDRVLVDCGLFQGPKDLRRRNWDDFPVPADSIDAVLLTHAHVDHCGYLPRLANQGFAGPAWCTPGTADLAGIVLPDSGHLHEEDAAYANRRGYSRHDPALPLYTEDDARGTLDQLVEVPFDREEEIVPGVTARWQRAGHILGAASIQVRVGDRTVLFSGDLGRPTHPLLNPPAPVGEADVVVCESTYGDRPHDDGPVEDTLARVVNETVDQGGVVVIPAFAVDRTEIVLWHLDRLTADGRIPRLPVFVDSPMALRALQAYRDAAAEGSPELRPEIGRGPLFAALDLNEAPTVEQSKAINERRGPLVVISASGMATGGRVLHHLAARLGASRNTVLLVGFQAPQTRGDQLRQGATAIKLHGAYRPVRAAVEHVGLSAHADRDDLLDWLGSSVEPPQVVYLVHGEEEASSALAERAHDALGLMAVVARPGERVILDPD